MQNKFEHTVSQVHQYVLMALMFVLPLEKKLAPPLVILLTLTWALQGNWKERWIYSKGKFALKCLLLFFAAYLIGLTYSNDLYEGWKSIEGKLSFLIIPLVFLVCIPFTRKQYRNLLLFFIVGCVFSSFYHLSLSVYDYYHEIELVKQKKVYDTYININYFFASLLGHRNHPGYLSMYFLLAIGVALHLLNNRNTYQLSRAWLVLVVSSLLILPVMIFLLASKMGLLLLMVLGLVTFIDYLFSNRSRKTVLVILVLFVGLVVLISRSDIVRSRFSYMFQRFSIELKDVDKTTVESNEVRLLVWDVAFKLIENEPVTGYGTGDAKKLQLQTYAQRGYTGALEHRLNAHSQFLQTQLEIGIPGSILLLLLMVSGIYTGYKQASYLLLWLMLIYLVNMLFEAVFEVQGGVVFFAVLLGILYNREKTTAITDEK